MQKAIEKTEYAPAGSDGKIPSGQAWLFRLKRWHLSTIRGQYVRSQIVLLADGMEQEVTVFSGANCLFFAQYTPFGTIAVHESAFTDEKLLNYVMTHETAHKRQWWSFLRFPLALAAAVLAPGLLSGSISAVEQAVATMDSSHLADFPAGIIAALILIALPCAFAWLMEIDADFRTIKAVGLRTFTEMTRISPRPSRPNLRTIVACLTHPPAALTTRLFRRLHRDSTL